MKENRSLGGHVLETSEIMLTEVKSGRKLKEDNFTCQYLRVETSLVESEVKEFPLV